MRNRRRKGHTVFSKSNSGERFDRAQKIKGDSGKNLLKLLELRFDNVIYRLGIADSRVQARQLVNHGHFKINNRKVNIPSYSLKSGDVITLRDSSKRSAYFKKVLESSKKNELPGWLNVDRKTLESRGIIASWG